MAKIEEVRVDLKFSKEVAENEWMSIGLGATATVSSDETFEMAIQEVEHQLRVEMRQSWGRLRRDKPQPVQDEVAQAPSDPAMPELAPFPHEEEPPPDPPVDPSWCPIHKVKMKKWTKEGRSWYSHPVGERDAPDSFWCQGEQE